MSSGKRLPVQLSTFKVDALRAAADGSEYTQGDTLVPGFGVRVRPSGMATYVLMKRAPGEQKPTRVTIGRVGDISLADAREKARDAIKALGKGVDVNLQKRRDLAAQTVERERVRQVESETGFPAGSFGATAAGYIRLECKALKRGPEVEAIIRRCLLPEWGSRPLDELRRRDLTALLDPVIAAGRIQAAHKLREIAIRVVNWAIDRGDIEVNFLATASRGRRRAGILRRTRRDRVLSDHEIRAVWNACDTVGQPFASLIRLGLLLGQRRQEIAAMEWSELDLDRGLWVIPARRYKTGTEHAVPLSDFAIEIIKSAPRASDRFVFATEPDSHFQGFGKSKRRLDKLADLATGWTIHDLRRTMRTGLSACGVGADVAERCVGHVITGVRGIYDRYSFADEKRLALEAWALRLRNIVNPPPAPDNNVLRFPAAG